MSIPLATTTVTIVGIRPQSAMDPDAEGYDPAGVGPAVLATGVRACISLPNGQRGQSADELNRYTLRMDATPTGLNQYDTVTDDSTGTTYAVESALPSVIEGFGLDHIKAVLLKSKGVRSGGENDELA